jgi:cation diffusion facilitator family transporter
VDGNRKVIVAGLVGNILVALTKYGAAFVTHSVAMMSEAVHSTVDTFNEVLLLYGAHRAARPPTAEHPLGYGREFYFWSFVVALLIFLVGAGVSILQGVEHVMHPHPMEKPTVSYVVLVFSALFEGGSWWVAFKEFRRRKGARGYLQAAVETKDPATVMVFFEDSAALLGIAIALAGTAASQRFEAPVFDGVASIAIGVLLAVMAVFLARENKQLLIGETARPQLVSSVRKIATEEPCVAHFNGLLTFQLAPREVVVALSLDFVPQLQAAGLQDAVDRLESRIRAAHPEIILVLIKPQSQEDYAKRHASLWRR